MQNKVTTRVQLFNWTLSEENKQDNLCIDKSKLFVFMLSAPSKRWTRVYNFTWIWQIFWPKTKKKSPYSIGKKSPGSATVNTGEYYLFRRRIRRTRDQLNVQIILKVFRCDSAKTPIELDHFTDQISGIHIIAVMWQVKSENNNTILSSRVNRNLIFPLVDVVHNCEYKPISKLVTPLELIHLTKIFCYEIL